MPSNVDLIYHLTCLLYASYLGKLWDPKNHEFNLKLHISCGFHCCVEDGYDWVDLCHPWNESQRPVFPRSFTLSAYGASDRACCRRYVCLSSCKDTIKQLQQETPQFIGPDLWPPNSPDLNLVDYKVWGVMQQRVYGCHMNSVDVWNSLQQNVIDAAIKKNEWRKKLRQCVRADGQHFEHLLWARVTNKSYGQIKYKSLKKMLVYCWTCDFQGSQSFPR